MRLMGSKRILFSLENGLKYKQLCNSEPMANSIL